MGLIIDGDRSLKHLGLANKLLRTLRLLRSSSKTKKWSGAKSIIHNGFTIIVKLLNAKKDDNSGLEKRIIIAPMGAIVAAAVGYPTGPTFEQRGIALMKADNWSGAFDQVGHYNCIGKGFQWSNFIKGYTEDELTSFGYSTFRFYPLLTLYPYPTPDPVLPGIPAVIGASDYPATRSWPVVHPYKGGEAYWMINTATSWNDLNSDDTYAGLSETTAHIEAFRNYYAADGGSMNGRMAYTFESVYGDAFLSNITRPCQMLPSSNLVFVTFHNGAYYDSVGSPADRKIASVIRIDADDTFSISYWTGTSEWADLPAGLFTIITSPVSDTSVSPLGCYGFATSIDGAATLLSVVDVTDTLTFGTSLEEAAYFAANPLDEKWKLFFTIRTEGGALTTFNSDNFISVLDTMSGGAVAGPPINWEMARETLMQLLPSPNNNFTVPHDSAMFHDSAGAVYTWTRKYGGFKWAVPTGLTVQAMSMPAETGTNGTRPTIYLCGTFGGVDMFICVCEDMEQPHEVKKVYYGSPFTSWTALPDPPTDFHLVYVRPIYFTDDPADTVQALGVLENEVDPGYNLTFLNFTDGVGEWTKLGKLPVDQDDYVTWSVGVFGKGPLVPRMASFLHQPTALPQMPIGPYGGYTLP